jgi:hypothetical protein
LFLVFFCTSMGWGRGMCCKYFYIIHHLENVTYSSQKHICCVLKVDLSEKFTQCNICNCYAKTLCCFVTLIKKINFPEYFLRQCGDENR